MAYIYERNPDTNEIFKRRLGSSKRELIEVTTIKTEYLNYWLKVNKIVKDTPNDMLLGEKIRELKTKIDNNMNNVSLYDYLGHAAGSELGQKVATAARQAGVRGEMREVSNPVYKGPVMLWPRAFLDLYFKGGLNEGTTGKQLLKG